MTLVFTKSPNKTLTIKMTFLFVRNSSLVYMYSSGKSKSTFLTQKPASQTEFLNPS